MSPVFSGQRVVAISLFGLLGLGLTLFDGRQAAAVELPTAVTHSTSPGAIQHPVHPDDEAD